MTINVIWLYERCLLSYLTIITIVGLSFVSCALYTHEQSHTNYTYRRYVPEKQASFKTFICFEPVIWSVYQTSSHMI